MTKNIKKAVPAVLAGATMLSIPVKAISSDENRLYGYPDSLHDSPEKLETSNLIRISIYDKNIIKTNNKIKKHIHRMFHDEDYASIFQQNKEKIYNEIGINQNDIEPDPNIKLLEIISIPKFRDAAKEKDYEIILQILKDHELIGSSDFSKVSERYERYLTQNKNSYEEIFSEKITDISPDDRYDPQCVTCISFAGVAVNVAAATNVVAAVIAVVYAGVWLWGAEQAMMDNNDPIDKLGSTEHLTDPQK